MKLSFTHLLFILPHTVTCAPPAGPGRPGPGGATPATSPPVAGGSTAGSSGSAAADAAAASAPAGASSAAYLGRGGSPAMTPGSSSSGSGVRPAVAPGRSAAAAAALAPPQCRTSSSSSRLNVDITMEMVDELLEMFQQVYSRSPPVMSPVAAGGTLSGAGGSPVAAGRTSPAALDSPPQIECRPTPDLATMKANIRKFMGRDKSVFWTAGKRDQAEEFAQIHGKVTINDSEAETKYGSHEFWEEPAKVGCRWCVAFAELTTGTTWVVHENLTPIKTGGRYSKSIWNEYELPGLFKRANGEPPVEEIIQVDARDLTRQVPIWPIDVRRYPENRCKWIGTPPLCRETRCPSGSKMVATSRYGPNMAQCHTGYKLFCCENGVVPSAIVSEPQSPGSTGSVSLSSGGSTTSSVMGEFLGR